MVNVKELLLKTVSALFLLTLTSQANAVTIDGAMIADPGAGALEGTIDGPGGVEMGLSVVDFPREYKITFAMTGLHFDIPAGQIDLADITVGQDLFMNAKISKMEMGGIQQVWIEGDPITAPKFIRISSEVSIDKITAAPVIGTLALLGSGFVGLVGVRRKTREARA